MNIFVDWVGIIMDVAQRVVPQVITENIQIFSSVIQSPTDPISIELIVFLPDRTLPRRGREGEVEGDESSFRSFLFIREMNGSNK